MVNVNEDNREVGTVSNQVESERTSSGADVSNSSDGTVGLPGGDDAVSRRDVLRGMSVAGAGLAGVTATSHSAEAGALTGDCVVSDWPEATDDRIDLSGDSPSETGDVPESGDLVIYVHGLFGEDIHDELDQGNGANQAAALDLALSEQGVETPVVAGMWDSTTTWTIAKYRADRAGETLTQWIAENRDSYDSLVVLGHSLGARVTLEALAGLADSDTTVTSVGLLGGAVDADSVCDEYEGAIEASVEETLYNYHSEGDSMVCYAYPSVEWTDGLGCEGSDCVSGGLPENFVDVDTTDEVRAHCNFYKPESMDFDGGTAIPEIVDRQFDGGDGDSGNGGGGDDDGGSGGGGGWCFITTATAKEPRTLHSLRRFRDESMAATPLGRGLVWLYYHISPPIATTLERHPESRTTRVVRSFVRRCASLSEAQEQTDSRVASVLLGTVLTMLYVIGILVAACGHAVIRATE